MYGVCARTAARTSAGFQALLYRKLLKIRSLPADSILNLFANDCHRVFHLVYTLPLVVGGPTVILFTFVYTYIIFGKFALVGLVVFALAFLAQIYVSKFTNRYRKQLLSAADDRVTLMNELLSNIKQVKLYALEKSFGDKLEYLREKEHKFVGKCLVLQCLSTSLAVITPIATTIATIVAFTWMGHRLSVTNAFVLVMVNYVAAHGIRLMPVCFRDLVQGKIALKRLQIILRSDERHEYVTLTSDLNNAIEFHNASLSPDSKMSSTLFKDMQVSNTSFQDGITLLGVHGRACLTDLNLTIPRGKLVAIVGSIASGKSSLFAGLLGQLKLLAGRVSMSGSVTYVAQEPWLLDTSLRRNITFYGSFDTNRYYHTISACGLTKDISSLHQGDETVIGESGTKLSGGQRARVAIARAFYADRDVYLFDEPLASIDKV